MPCSGYLFMQFIYSYSAIDGGECVIEMVHCNMLSS